MRRPRTLRGSLHRRRLRTVGARITVLTIAFNIALTRSVASDADNRLRTQAAAAATTVAVEDGAIKVLESRFDAALDRQVWVFAGTRPVEQPGGNQALLRSAVALAGTSHVLRDLPEQEYRLYSVPLRDHGRQIGTVVSGLSLAGYDRTQDFALIASLALAALLLAAVTALTWVVIGRALLPVRDMTRSAASWSAQGDAHRFGSTPRHDELGELAQTFDALLDRVAASLRHEQRLSAELSHELRTPLARIVAEVELLQRRERAADERAAAYGAIARSAQRMSDIVATLMAAARADAGLDRGRCDIAVVLREFKEEWPAGGVQLSTSVDGESVTAGVESEVVHRILAPLLDNARRHARGDVHVTAASADGRVAVTVADDGAGVPAELLEHVFEPGAQIGDLNGHGGAGLGLALSRRLARAAGGDVRAESATAGGAAFCVELPV